MLIHETAIEHETLRQQSTFGENNNEVEIIQDSFDSDTAEQRTDLVSVRSAACGPDESYHSPDLVYSDSQG